MDDWRKNLRFFRSYNLSEAESFTVYGRGTGHVQVNGMKHLLGKEIDLKPGSYLIEVFIGNMTGLPCIFPLNKPIRPDALPGTPVKNIKKLSVDEIKDMSHSAQNPGFRAGATCLFSMNDFGAKSQVICFNSTYSCVCPM